MTLKKCCFLSFKLVKQVEIVNPFLGQLKEKEEERERRRKKGGREIEVASIA